MRMRKSGKDGKDGRGGEGRTVGSHPAGREIGRSDRAIDRPTDRDRSTDD